MNDRMRGTYVESPAWRRSGTGVRSDESLNGGQPRTARKGGAHTGARPGRKAPPVVRGVPAFPFVHVMAASAQRRDSAVWAVLQYI
jgi:hypothetical protein